MQWDDIRYFLALARKGSLSATARSLKVEHSTVARRATALERDLQLKLFDRLARRWQLTPEGQQFFEQARFLEEEMLALERTALARTPLAGRVHLSVPPLVMNFFLITHLGQFRHQYPGIDLEITGENRISNIMQGEAHIALRIKEPEEPGLIARPLATIHYGLYATPELLARPASEQALIGFDDTIPNLPQKHWLDEYARSHPYTLRTNDIMTMYQAALQGWGIAMIPRLLAAKDKRLHPLPEPTPPPRTLYMVIHPDVLRAPRMRAMADFLVEVFKTHQDEL